MGFFARGVSPLNEWGRPLNIQPVNTAQPGHARLTSRTVAFVARYRAALALAREVREALVAWGWMPRDFIDVQSFLWVALVYDSTTEPSSRP